MTMLVPTSPRGPDFILLTHYTRGLINVHSILPTTPWGNPCMHAVYGITWYGMVKYVYGVHGEKSILFLQHMSLHPTYSRDRNPKTD